MVDVKLETPGGHTFFMCVCASKTEGRSFITCFGLDGNGKNNDILRRGFISSCTQMELIITYSSAMNGKWISNEWSLESLFCGKKHMQDYSVRHTCSIYVLSLFCETHVSSLFCETHVSSFSVRHMLTFISVKQKGNNVCGINLADYFGRRHWTLPSQKKIWCLWLKKWTLT